MAYRSTAATSRSLPYLGLAEALRVAEEIQHQGGGSLSMESLSSILGNSVKSSSFQAKLSALRRYGLVEVQRDRVSLTQHALSYVAPTTATERAEAAMGAMRSIEIMARIHDRFAGGLLPSREQLANLLLREYEIGEASGDWADFILESLRTADLINVVGGRTMIRGRPEPAGDGAGATGPTGPTGPTGAYGADGSSFYSSGRGPSGPVGPQPGARSGQAQASPTINPGNPILRVDLPLSGGGQGVIMIPRSATEDDYSDIISMLEIMRQRAKRTKSAVAGEEVTDSDS